MTHQSCCRWTLLRSITAGRWTAVRGLSCCRCYHPSNKSAADLWDRWYNELHAFASTHPARTYQICLHACCYDPSNLNPSNAWLSIPPSLRCRPVAHSGSLGRPPPKAGRGSQRDRGLSLRVPSGVAAVLVLHCVFPIFLLKKKRLASCKSIVLG